MNKQIAADMGVTEITVKIHRGHVMRKMKARSRSPSSCSWPRRSACAAGDRRQSKLRSKPKYVFTISRTGAIYAGAVPFGWCRANKDRIACSAGPAYLHHRRRRVRFA